MHAELQVASEPECDRPTQVAESAELSELQTPHPTDGVVGTVARKVDVEESEPQPGRG